MNSLSQARLFSLLGFQDASAMLARRHIEACMRARIPVNHAGHRPKRLRTAGSMIPFLFEKNVIDQQTRFLAKKSIQVANNVVHGGSIGRTDTWKLLKDTRTLEVALQVYQEPKRSALVSRPVRRIAALITAMYYTFVNNTL